MKASEPLIPQIAAALLECARQKPTLLNRPTPVPATTRSLWSQQRNPTRPDALVERWPVAG